MKLFLALALVVVAVSAGGSNSFLGGIEDFEQLAIKKWTFFKAMEGCVGKEVSDLFIAKKKEAVTKCFGKPTPEREFPMFKSVSTVGEALAHASMKEMKEEDDEPSMDQMFKKYIFEKAFKDMMEKDEQEGAMKFFRSKFQHRFRRDADEKKEEMSMKEMALGEKLTAKLNEEKEVFTVLAGNLTCLAQQCGTLNAEGKFNTEAEILKKFDGITLPDPYLTEHFKKDVHICYEITNALPAEVLTECQLGPELYKVNYFKKCLKDRKIKTCMNFDIKQRIEKNFGSMTKMVEETKMSEKELIPLVRKLLNVEDM